MTTIKTHYGTTGQYKKADRSNKTDYPVLIENITDKKLYWIGINDISEVSHNGNKMTGEKFANLLQITRLSH